MRDALRRQLQLHAVVGPTPRASAMTATAGAASEPADIDTRHPLRHDLAGEKRRREIPRHASVKDGGFR